MADNWPRVHGRPPVDAIRSPLRPHISPPPAAWPHAAQLAAAFLLAAAAALLAVRVFQGSAGRPLELVTAPPLDLNRADPGDLLQLPGVGPVLANRIVEARDVRGGFRSAEEWGPFPAWGRPVSNGFALGFAWMATRQAAGCPTRGRAAALACRRKWTCRGNRST